MQTTLRFDDTLLRQAKAEAAKMGITLTRYIEEALRQRLRRRSGDGRPGRPGKVRLPVSGTGGGFARGIRNLREARDAVEDAEAADLVRRRG
jgi:hypothetical protein